VKIFLDTNVLAAGFATRGLCSDIVREILENHELVTSLETLGELRRFLESKFKVPANQLEDVIELIHSCSQISEPDSQASYDIQDKDDMPHLSAAENAGCEYFVTGDKELWSVSPLESMRVLPPRDLWKATQTNPFSREDKPDSPPSE
jgi:putative PIN family toxin of toxin-antitoxin system